MKKFYQLTFLLLLWGPPLFRGRNVYRSVQSSLRGEVDQAAWIEVAVWLAVAGFLYLRVIGMALLAKLPVSPVFLRGACGAYLVYVALAVLSVAYAPAPTFAGFRAFQLLAAVTACATILTYDLEDGCKGLITPLLLFCAVNTAYNIIAFFLQPDWVVATLSGGARRLMGGYLFRLDYGLSAMVTAVWTGQRLITRKPWWPVAMAGFGVAATALILSGTRAMIVSVCVGLVLLALSSAGKLGGGVGLLAVGLVGVGIMIGWEFITSSDVSEYAVRSESLGSFSGRLDAWPGMLARWWDAPLLQRLFGFGFATGTRVVVTSLHHKGFGNAHNAYIEVLLGVGLLGCLVILTMIWLGLKNVARVLFESLPDELGAPGQLAAVLFVCMLVSSIVGQSFANVQYLDLMIFLTALYTTQGVLFAAAESVDEEEDDPEDGLPATVVVAESVAE